MRHLTNVLSLARRRPVDPETALRLETEREWQRLLSEATSAAERADIDAMFARSAA